MIPVNTHDAAIEAYRLSASGGEERSDEWAPTKVHRKAMEKAVEAVLEEHMPSNMIGCRIKFIECNVGHSRLVTTDWVDNGCPWCKIADLEKKDFDGGN